ncbi:uncharacterized protein LOC126821179 [Patella vulgata]|uniref:uncharacterized protein LOC126821179 n=1 Tax=Patella vulgata TaxID=6465 RepID=UPI0024A850EE|nr:uncharacterized protein LOC126821179 [Patella vulgata]
MANIQEMFYQCRVVKYDCDMMRFLWWPEGQLDKPLCEYRMLVHLFGASSLPSCSNFALKQVACDNKNKCSPEVINAINNNFYVDDFLKSMPNENDAIKLVKEICVILKLGGFNLTKWLSNSRQLLSTIPEKDRVEEVKKLDFETDNLPIKRAPSVQWSVVKDRLEFDINIVNPKATRRNILSAMSSVYDPCGFVAPYVLKAKMILQELCRAKLSWDETIPETHKLEWEKWLIDLPNLSKVKVNRCLVPNNFGKVVNTDLHHFGDACQTGYGTVTYVGLRFVNSEGDIHVAFVLGRSRVAPIRPHTIVKLELSAATCLVRINTMLLRELSIPVNSIYFWTDSQTIIKYIRNDKMRHQIFVSNRLAIIHDGSDVSQWHYVPSKLNCENYASCGLSASDLMNSEWLFGPEFLRQPSSEWPSYPVA